MPMFRTRGCNPLFYLGIRLWKPMPRGSRIDAVGAVHHIMVRGIERRKIFDGDADRDHFLHRMGEILLDTETTCFAWSLMPKRVERRC